MRFKDFVSMDRVLKSDYDIVRLYFDSSNNRLVDEDGYLYANNLFNLITPSDLLLLKNIRDTIYVMDRKDELWYEIMYCEGGF
jgi:hypothetical protein